MYLAIGVGLLLVALVIPGLRVMAEAVLKVIFEFFVEILRHKGTFAIWFIKTLFADHSRVFKHATQSRDVIDPTQKIRRKAEGYDD